MVELVVVAAEYLLEEVVEALEALASILFGVILAQLEALVGKAQSAEHCYGTQVVVAQKGILLP
jgi:hypothetical protein